MLVGHAILIPAAALALIMAVFLWRVRGHVPEVLRNLRPLLAADEPVLGDGIGMVRGERGRYDAFRLIVATDRRVLVVASTRAKRPFLVVDVPYERVSRFGIEWAYLARAGVLTLTVTGVDGAPSETHAITYIAPANLVSIARALRLHGVDAEASTTILHPQGEYSEARA